MFRVGKEKLQKWSTVTVCGLFVFSAVLRCEGGYELCG